MPDCFFWDYKSYENGGNPIPHDVRFNISHDVRKSQRKRIWGLIWPASPDPAMGEQPEGKERDERERTVGDLEAEVVNLRHKLRMKEIESEEMVSSCSQTTMSSSHLSRNLCTRKTTTARSIEVSVTISSTGSSSSHNVDDLMKGATMDVVDNVDES
ncbi:hypothetical protein Droror1_Dr00011436 [Drosera rotundifolia]